MNKKLRVSIVIPVYNEQEYLRSCLEAVAAQTVEPYEVIVVDNNSTDNTTQIAQSFPFVTLLQEPKQGVVNARNRGFNEAHGEIIGRIDADTTVSPDWVAHVQAAFKSGKIGAITGSVHYQDVAASKIVDSIDLFWRRHLAKVLDREVAIQGANMAMRRDIWQVVRSSTCNQPGYHEDFDLAIHINQAGFMVAFDENLRVSICSRRVADNFIEFSRYALISPRTYTAHGLKSARHMYPVVAFVIACYFPIKVLHRGYDASTQRFSWRQSLRGNVTARVNPATFVD